jgi:hypothetical protein
MQYLVLDHGDIPGAAPLFHNATYAVYPTGAP